MCVGCNSRKETLCTLKGARYIDFSGGEDDRHDAPSARHADEADKSKQLSIEAIDVGDPR